MRGSISAVEEPKPRTPRSESGQLVDLDQLELGHRDTTSWAMRIPGSTTNGAAGSVFRRLTRSSPR